MLAIAALCRCARIGSWQVLAPIGGLNLQRIDPSIATDKPCDVADVRPTFGDIIGFI